MTSLLEVSALQWPRDKEGDEFYSLCPWDVLVAVQQYLFALLSPWLLVFLTRARTWLWTVSHKMGCAPKGTQLQDSAPWLQELQSVRGYEKVMDHDSLTAEDSLMPMDHLFRALACNELVQDYRVLMSPKVEPVQTPDQSALTPFSVITAWQLGSDVCGHAGIVHGGMTAAMIDESFGYLMYLARQRGLLEFKAVFTANLEVSYKLPLLPNQPVCVTTWISNVQGRKIWLEAVVSDKPLLIPNATTTTTTYATNNDTTDITHTNNDNKGMNGDAVGAKATESATEATKGGEEDMARPVAEEGTVFFATSQALFIVPRANGASSARLAEASKGRADTLDAAVPAKRAKAE